MTEPDPMLKVSEVAVIFGVQPATIREWLKDGLLEGIKIGSGHYWRVRTSAVTALAQKKYGD